MNYGSEEEYNYAMGAQAEAEAEHHYAYYQWLDEMSRLNPYLFALYYCIDLLQDQNKPEKYAAGIEFLTELKKKAEQPVEPKKPENISEPDDLPF